MKSQAEKPIHLTKDVNSFLLQKGAAFLQRKISSAFTILKHLPSFQNLFRQGVVFLTKIKSTTIANSQIYFNEATMFVEKTKRLGLTASMDEYEKRKLTVFNLINLLQLVTGLIVPVFVIITAKTMTFGNAFILITPSLTSLAVLYLNSKNSHEIAMLSYFIMYPFFTSLAYMNGISLGVELFFVLNGILCVFFLKNIGYIIFCIAFSMVNYFMLGVVLNVYRYDLEKVHPFFYMFNQLLAIIFIFYGLYLIKKENNGYQSNLLATNRLLEEQTMQLNEVDAFKTRLFSIVSHDLKSPMYALRNLFIEINQNRIPAEEVKKLVPYVIKDLTYTTGLMDNLLHWAKSQMHAGAVVPQVLNVTEMMEEIIQQHRLQAELKDITIEFKAQNPIHIFADRDMTSLVIRNLFSNAIKFTPENGTVTIGANETGSSAEVFVTDTGAGMNEATLKKIRSNNYFSTKGTANEPGTGLGLMLCKEFLLKNNGQMHIESQPGQGSTFSFTLPLAD
jgi:two-component system sensor histidine kinase/response regulator